MTRFITIAFYWGCGKEFLDCVKTNLTILYSTPHLQAVNLYYFVKKRIKTALSIIWNTSGHESGTLKLFKATKIKDVSQGYWKTNVPFLWPIPDPRHGCLVTSHLGDWRQCFLLLPTPTNSAANPDVHTRMCLRHRWTKIILARSRGV